MIAADPDDLRGLGDHNRLDALARLVALGMRRKVRHLPKWDGPKLGRLVDYLVLPFRVTVVVDKEANEDGQHG